MTMKTTLSEEILDALANKLDEFAQVLTPDEQALLLTVFRLGANALGEVGQQVDTESAGFGGRSIRSLGRLSPTGPTSPHLGPAVLSQSIKNAFRPALARGLNGINVAADGVEVGGSVKWSA